MSADRRQHPPMNEPSLNRFMRAHCDMCARWQTDTNEFGHEIGCSIAHYACEAVEANEAVPAEWVEDDERGPHCTAFQQQGAIGEKPYRCPNTVDLFDTEGR